MTLGMNVWGIRALLIVAAMTSSTALAAAQGNQWNERTTLTFSTPVMVPGATLPAGKYIFELVNLQGNRQLVRVRVDGEQDVLAVAQAVPLKRLEAKEDTVLHFSATDTKTPPAIKAWFYPGSLYGHEFVYPEEQARHIAERTKSIALAVDVPGTDLERGVLWTYDASGRRSAWKADAQTRREWDEWARVKAKEDPDERKAAEATAVRTDFRGTRVDLGDLEGSPQKYMGQTISVDGEVEDIYGPRLFTIDEARWGGLGGEVLVLLPSSLAALVKEDDQVTISGTLKPYVRTEVEREWGWLGLDPEIETEVALKPIVVAERLVGGDKSRVMVIETKPAENRPVGTSGAASTNTLTNGSALASADQAFVGRNVNLNNMRVSGNPSGSGFFVDLGGRTLFVLPSQQSTTVATGDAVALTGVILRMPRGMVTRLKAPANLNTDIYIYATGVKK